MESLLLGNMEQNFEGQQAETLNYLFNYQALKDGESTRPYQLNLMNYRGFYEEGRNLLNFCQEERREIAYASDWERGQTKRAMMATLQYIGLDMLAGTLAGYAKYFEFSESDFGNFTEVLVGESCSQNLTIISLKELKRNLRFRFRAENPIAYIPTIENNPLFPDKIKSQTSQRDMMEKEFAENIRLFKSLCSWGNDIDNARLLVPLLRNPVVMSFIIRQMTGMKFNANIESNEISLTSDSSTVKILCRGLICRRESNSVFEREFPKSIGQRTLNEDLRRLYCEDLRAINYTTRDQEPWVKKIIDTQSFDEENFLISTFISLSTGVPDFFIRADSFSEGRTFTRYSIDNFYDAWAKEQATNKGRELLYEESLTLDIVDRKHYFLNTRPKLGVIIDINLGEYDKVLEILGKVKSRFTIKLQNSFIFWIKKRMGEINPNNPSELQALKDRLEVELAPEVERVKKLFDLPPWQEGLETLLAGELFSQIGLLESFPMKDGAHDISIQFNYGIFALKYLEHRRQVTKLLDIRQKEIEAFKEQQKKRQEKALSSVIETIDDEIEDNQ